MSFNIVRWFSAVTTVCICHVFTHVPQVLDFSPHHRNLLLQLTDGITATLTQWTHILQNNKSANHRPKIIHTIYEHYNDDTCGSPPNQETTWLACSYNTVGSFISRFLSRHLFKISLLCHKYEVLQSTTFLVNAGQYIFVALNDQ